MSSMCSLLFYFSDEEVTLLPLSDSTGKLYPHYHTASYFRIFMTQITMNLHALFSSSVLELFVLFLTYELYVSLYISLTFLVTSYAWTGLPQIVIPKSIFSQNNFPLMRQMG